MADQKSQQEVVLVENETGSITGSDMSSGRNRGIVVYIDVITAGGGDVTVTVQRKSPVSTDEYEDLGASAAVSAEGLTTLTIYPGIGETANVSISDVIGAMFRINAAVSGTITYSIGYALIP